MHDVLLRLERDGIPAGQWTGAEVEEIQAQWDLYRTAVPRFNADVLRGLGVGDSFLVAWEQTRTLDNLYPANRAPEGTHAIHTTSNNLLWPLARDDAMARHLPERTPWLAITGAEDMRTDLRVARARTEGSKALQKLAPATELVAAVCHHVARGWSVALQRSLQLREDALCQLGQRMQRVDATLAPTTMGLALSILLPTVDAKLVRATWDRWKAQLPNRHDTRTTPTTYLSKCRDAYSSHIATGITEIRTELLHWTTEQSPCWIDLLNAAGVYDCRWRAWQSMQRLWNDGTSSMFSTDTRHPSVARALAQAEQQTQESERALLSVLRKSAHGAEAAHWKSVWESITQRWRNVESVAGLLIFIDQTWGAHDRVRWEDIEACSGPVSSADGVAVQQSARVSLIKRLLDDRAVPVPDACTETWKNEASAWSTRRSEFLEVAHESIVQRQEQLRDARTESAQQPLVLLTTEERIPSATVRAWATCEPISRETAQCGVQCLPDLSPLRQHTSALLLRLGKHMHELVTRFPESIHAMLSRLRRFVHGELSFDTVDDVQRAAHEWSVLCVYANLLDTPNATHGER